MLGHAAESRRFLDALVTRYGDSKPFELAMAYVRMGDTPSALDWLERAHAQRDPGMRYVKYLPALKPLLTGRSTSEAP